ncbi:uncharacterized protein LY89DRAFT_578582 [Mollisia scopiformis]|uniref:Copper-fist domain-containing protein n=1 Tax=Mollisia scopiformis TaxID=149040 RepID=A0A194XJQ2_MOLSC|nr:uncharacterized protein LY89DRAFT_578582 [Mollisia scopiformis]KUJ20344.1 hypothetical protein LY89DRAFT_578582 [Mollisia scopiformis]
MPLINGLKMACEPCIRGHRSTKCTHANERLMVPVRKPGRPLSACPHPRGQTCGCGSVTAAIPRKQTCHCGTPAQGAAQVVPRPANGTSDLPSPSKPSFKVQKTSRPPSSRKQSFDPSNLERMDMNHVNIQPFEQRSQTVPTTFTNGYTMANPAPVYGFTPQYANIQPQFGMVPMQPPPNRNGIDGSNGHMPSTNGYSNGVHHNGLEHVIESPLAKPVTFKSGDSGKFTNEQSYTEPAKSGPNGNVISNGGSCCAPKQGTHSHSSSSSSISETRETQGGGCCGSKADKPIFKEETMSNGTSAKNTPHLAHQTLPQNGLPFNPVMYQQFVSQPTIFTYPPSYGSWQNPLQPSAWRDGMRSNYAQGEIPLPPNEMPFNTPIMPASLDTVHTCSCGDTCQCIGCAAHPYNDATQDYVRSAYASMSIEKASSEVYSNGQPAIHDGTNGHDATQGQNIDPVASPTAQTPSSTTSGNADDQNLSADNFLFVNYPFTGEGCGGTMQECPCGDDCECIGCTIHGNQIQNIPMPCCGSQDDCPCGDDCQCIGCEIHKNTSGS